MESTAHVVAAAAALGAVAMLLLVALVLLVTRRRRSRADLEAMLAAAQREADDLRHRLEELSGTQRPAPGGPAYLDELFAEAAVPAQRSPEPADFVITHVGEPGDEAREDLTPLAVPDRLVLSATLGEPLVKVAAFSHGVRRALSAQSRNRIWFEMRREVRSARRRRLRLRKDLMREYRARQRAMEDVFVEDRA